MEHCTWSQKEVWYTQGQHFWEGPTLWCWLCELFLTDKRERIVSHTFISFFFPKCLCMLRELTQIRSAFKFLSNISMLACFYRISSWRLWLWVYYKLWAYFTVDSFTQLLLFIHTPHLELFNQMVFANLTAYGNVKFMQFKMCH